MQISNRVFLLGSGKLGCSMSHPNDCNVYAVSCGKRFVVVDTGVGLEQHRIFSECSRDGIGQGLVSAVLVTHGHLDHAGGASGLHAFLDAPVYASAATAAALETGDERAISLAEAKQAGVYGAEFRLLPCPVERVLRDGEQWEIEDVRITAIAARGHAADMLAFHVTGPDESFLFGGDSVFSGGRVLISDTWDCEPQEYARTIRRLCRLDLQGFYPGHGIWSVSDGSRHLEAALSYVDRLLFPPNLI